MRTPAFLPKAILLSAALFSGAGATASEQQDFLVRNTKDLVDLCATQPGDPLYVAAIHFCNGFVVGAYRYHESLYSGPDATPLVCPPSPRPSREQAIADFVAWSKSHPERDSEPAVDGLFRFLTERWPCSEAQGNGTPSGRAFRK